MINKKIFVFFCLFSILNYDVTAGTSEHINLLVTTKINGKTYQKDLISFIEENKQIVKSMSNIQSKAIMVLGLTGTGKSTLVNYLNNIPLICKKINQKWVIELQSENLTLQGGFSIAKIGHKVYSQTFLPAGYTPQGKDFTYIDNPGFKDTHGLSIEIANGFFREQITANVIDLKFLLVLTDSDLRHQRGQQFRDSIKAFSHFIGLFDQKLDEAKAKELSKSIGIIVTKVDNDGETDDVMKQTLQLKLNEILDDLTENNKLSKNEEIVFKEIIKNFQIEIFSNPKKYGLVISNQATAINFLLNKMQYAKKNDLNIRVKIEEAYRLELYVYTMQNNALLQEKFEEIINICVSRLIKKRKINQHLNATTELFIQLNELLKTGSYETDLQSYLKTISDQILSAEDRDELINRKETIHFFTQFFTEKERLFFPLRKKWIVNKMKSKLEHLSTDLTHYLALKYKEFEQSIETTIEKCLINFIERKINEADDINDIKEIEAILNEFRLSITKAANLESLIENINREILSENEAIELQNTKYELNKFISLLSDDKRNEFLIYKQSITIDFVFRFDNLTNHLKQYYQETSTYENSVYTYNGHFALMTTILNAINNRTDTKNLKSVVIYAMNSVKFDDDFYINPEFYFSNSPDLVIISPKVLTTKPIIINLSTEHSPGYPDNANKAMLQYWYRNDGRDGSDGEPGLPGFNGGNLLIIAGSISNNISFVSNGSLGGPGQEGENGNEGREGTRGRMSDVQVIHRETPGFAASDSEYLNAVYPASSETVYLRTEQISNSAVRRRWIKYYGSYGEPGSKGGNSGKGGHGGYNGLSGKSVLIDKSGTVEYLLEQESFGKHGPPGQPGLGGRYGDTAVRGYFLWRCGGFTFTLTLSFGCLYEYISPGFFYQYDNYESNDTRAADGSINNEINQNGIMKPQRNEINIEKNKKDFLKFVSRMSSTFINNQFISTDPDFIKDILDSTYTDPEVSILLEKVLKLSTKKLNKHRYFQLMDLKKAITEYIQTKKSSQIELSILSYIQATLYSLILRFKSSHEYFLVDDLEHFLEVTLSQINNWKELSQQNVRDIYRVNNENSLKSKIKEVKLILNKLKLDTQNTKNELDKDIIVELSQLKEEDLQLGHKKLEKALLLKTILSSIEKSTVLMSHAVSNQLPINADTPSEATDPNSGFLTVLTLENQTQIIETNVHYLEEENQAKDLKLEIVKLYKLNYQVNQTDQNITIRKKEDSEENNLMLSLLKKEEEKLKVNSQEYSRLLAIEKRLDDMINNLFGQKVNETLNDLKSQIFNLTSSIIGHKQMTNIISRTENALHSIINIQSRIETFVQQNEFISFISSITQMENASLIPTEFKDKLDSLKISIHNNLIEERFQQAVDACNHWSFPFHCEYTRNITNYAIQLEELLDYVKKDKAGLEPSLNNRVFQRLFDEKAPFFQWNSDNYPIEIKQLLSGQSSTLYADIDYARFDAIKFTTLYLQIESDESNSNKILNELLEHFYIELTHSGESNFKYREKIYKIDMNYESEHKLMLKYQYGIRSNANASYKSLEINRPVLSPYTFWTIRIKAVKREKEVELLKKIKTIVHGNVKIKMSLCGQGLYVDSL